MRRDVNISLSITATAAAATGLDSDQDPRRQTEAGHAGSNGGLNDEDAHDVQSKEGNWQELQSQAKSCRDPKVRP